MKPKRKTRERTNWKSLYFGTESQLSAVGLLLTAADERMREQLAMLEVLSRAMERANKEVSDLTHRLQLAEKLGDALVQDSTGHKAQITSLQHQIEVGDELIAKQRAELINLRSQPKPWWAKSFGELFRRTRTT